jgi:hypothetical protein
MKHPGGVSDRNADREGGLWSSWQAEFIEAKSRPRLEAAAATPSLNVARDHYRRKFSVQ